MRNTALHLSGTIAAISSFRRLYQKSYPVFLPFYHVVSNENLPHVKNYPYRDVETFERELDFILKYYQPITLQELKNRVGHKKVFHLSFDDGLKECAEIIAPILKRKGIPATFFVNTGFVGNKALFHKYKASLILDELGKRTCDFKEEFDQKDNFQEIKSLKNTIHDNEGIYKLAEILQVDFDKFLEVNKPYLTLSQLQQLKEDGFTIGAHSIDHPEFWLIKEEEQFRQVAESVNWVKENLGQDILAFAFPFTDNGVPGGVFKKIEENQLCDITFGTAGLKYDQYPWHFQRFACEGGDSLEKVLKKEMAYFNLRKCFGQQTVKHS